MPVIKDAYIPDAKRVTEVNRQGTDDIKKMTEGIRAVNDVREVASALSGVESIQEELKRKEQKMEEIEKEKKEVEQELQETKMEVVQKELGGKIDRLSEDVKSGASKKSIGEQITDIKKTAIELGLGTSKVSEIKEMADLIERFNPRKDLAQQIREAKDILSVLQPEKGKEAHIEGVPAEIAVQLKKMDTDLQIKLEEIKDARQERDQNFQVTLKKWEEERDIRRQEVDGKILVERERNELMSGALKTVGGAIAKGLIDHGAGGATSLGGISQKPQSTVKLYRIEVGQGQEGDFECPNCHTPVAIGPTSTEAQCVECNSRFPIARVPITEGTKEPLPPDKEEE